MDNAVNILILNIGNWNQNMYGEPLNEHILR